MGTILTKYLKLRYCYDSPTIYGTNNIHTHAAFNKRAKIIWNFVACLICGSYLSFNFLLPRYGKFFLIANH